MASTTKHSFLQYGFDKRIIHGILMHILLLPVYCDMKFDHNTNIDINLINLDKFNFSNSKKKHDLMENLSIANSIKLMPGVYLREKHLDDIDSVKRSIGMDSNPLSSFQKFLSMHEVDIELPRLKGETGRLFFFKGLKKLMWPLLIGFQLVKTVLLVLFLPSIIGSVGKIVGKGLPTLSGFAHPAETVEDLEFRDNFDGEKPLDDFMDNKESASSINRRNAALSRLGIERSKLGYVDSMNHNYKRIASKRDDFQTFHDIPNSSLLLTNYDPFYSPLLSRLDVVFQQLNLSSSSQEKCREKLICMMYANPAKYAPYSNLVSAQLSRELNELRKPISDNPDILRFFKYMKAAKDGQDGVDCELANKECSTYNDMISPAMVNTFNDINKLVHARKI